MNLATLQTVVQRAAAFQRHADDNGFGRPQPTTWWTVHGWTRGHLSRGQTTACGRGISGPLIPAPDGMPHCGQCMRGRP